MIATTVIIAATMAVTIVTTMATIKALISYHKRYHVQTHRQTPTECHVPRFVEISHIISHMTHISMRYSQSHNATIILQELHTTVRSNETRRQFPEKM